ncbi:hypothetical protein LKK83_18300 [Phormidium sp. CCY1219]|nr:hypothetical protein [Phormidium sp. CCY1219]
MNSAFLRCLSAAWEFLPLLQLGFSRYVDRAQVVRPFEVIILDRIERLN